MFESKRKQTVVEIVPQGYTLAPHESMDLRDEVDSDPFIEEMVARLRDGLSSLHAVDEWGRPLAWRNVVRLAVGPMVSALRDSQTATEIAVSLLPESTPAVEQRAPELDVAGHLVGWPDRAHQDWATLPQVAEVEPLVVEPVPEPVAVEPTPEPVAEVAPVVAAPTAPVAAVSPTYPGSLFRVSGDQRPVAVGTLSPGQVLRQGGSYDSTTAKYDRFLTGLYGERKQVGGDQDGGTGGAGLGDDRQGGVDS